jgi:transcription antitermination factor NusG
METIADTELRLSGFEVFSPMVASLPMSEIHSGGRPLLTPLFDRYLFCRFDRVDPAWHSINRMRGIEGVLGTSPGMPAAMPEAEMAAIRSECELNDCIYEAEPPANVRQMLRDQYPIGSEVELLASRVVGFTGIVQWSSARRVRVLLRILGGGDGVTINVLRREIRAVEAA